MFVSFFPRPSLFFPSALLWTVLAMAVWYGFAINLFQAPEKRVGLATFWSAPALWFDLYFALTVAIFAAPWMLFTPHPWTMWSILGSALILFTSYFQVQVSVAINSWYGPFYDMIQAALSKSAPVTVEQFYSELATFAGIALVAVVVGVMTRFFVSHYIFRWRTAMNDFYVANWPRLHTIEGASQRVQEDTMRFASTMESLGVNLISAVLTLLAFLPVLVRLSSNVTELPLFGSVPYPLVFAAVIWSVLGTGVLALIGIRLPSQGCHLAIPRKYKPSEIGEPELRRMGSRSARPDLGWARHSSPSIPVGVYRFRSATDRFSAAFLVAGSCWSRPPQPLPAPMR